MEKSWRRMAMVPACTSAPPRKRLGVMTWGCITFNGVGTLDFVEGSINAVFFFSYACHLP